LSELDRDYGNLARRLGITHYRRVPALNDRPRFLDALADLVHRHLVSGEVYSRQYELRCGGCENQGCRAIVNQVTSKGVKGEK
jgi:ferrochelatase